MSIHTWFIFPISASGVNCYPRNTAYMTAVKILTFLELGKMNHVWMDTIYEWNVPQQADIERLQEILLTEMTMSPMLFWKLNVCTTSGILSEVYAALTWIGAQPQHPPEEAANAIRLLIEPPSTIHILPDGRESSLKMLELAERYHLTARRVHDARHAAMAIVSGVRHVYTYNVQDWQVFKPERLTITGPDSVLQG